MKKQDFIGKIRRGLYNGLAAGALILSPILLPSCGDSTGPGRLNNKPVNSLNISPTSGYSPLEVRIQGNCTDVDGNLRDYRVISNGNIITRTNPIDTTINLAQNTSFISECEDMSGDKAVAGPIDIQVLQPSVSQTATLNDYIDINYSARLAGVSQATRKILRNGNLIDTKTISGPNYSETFSGNHKGNYMVILEALGVKPDTARIDVPDYLPNANLSGLQTDMDEEDTARVSLESRFEDKNFEDNPHLRSAQSLEGKTRVNIAGDSVIINALGDSTGTYRVQIEFGSPEGGIATSVLQGNINDLPTVSGNLESNETHTGIPGTIRFYQIVNNDTLPLRTRSSDSLGNNATNADGSFTFKINKRTSQLENILVMAREGTPNNYQGYVRTITLPGKDTSGVLIRAVPYGFYASNPGVFRQFMQELAGDRPNTRFDFNGEFIPGFHGFQGIEILGQNPFGFQYGEFTAQQQNLIRGKILDPNDINALVQNRINSGQIIIGNQGHYTLDSATQKVVPNPGWVVVVPDNNLGFAGLTDYYEAGTLVYSGTIYINPNSEGNTRVISHEFGHMFIGTGHPTSINPNESVMNLSTSLENTGIADKKAGLIIYEPTFMVFPNLIFPHVDDIFNTLRLDFK